MPTLTHADAIAIAKRSRKLLRAGRITHRQFAVVDCLLWCCRSPSGAIVVSYTGLQRLTRVARATVAGAVAALERLGVLTRIRRRVRVAWGAAVASRQATSAYALHPRTEFSRRTVDQNDTNLILAVPGATRVVEAAQKALARRRAVIEARLMGVR
jgi:hypothetical protein